MATATKVIDNVTIDGSSTSGIQQAVEQAIVESSYKLVAKLSRSVGAFDPGSLVNIVNATSPEALSAASDAPAQLGRMSEKTRLKVTNRAEVVYFETPIQLAVGGFHYTWLDVPETFPASQITVWLIEL